MWNMELKSRWDLDSRENECLIQVRLLWNQDFLKFKFRIPTRPGSLQISNVGPLFACSLGGAIFVILGLVSSNPFSSHAPSRALLRMAALLPQVTFISALSANYMRLKYTKELTDYRVTAEQNTELEYIPYAKSTWCQCASLPRPLHVSAAMPVPCWGSPLRFWRYWVFARGPHCQNTGHVGWELSIDAKHIFFILFVYLQYIPHS